MVRAGFCSRLFPQSPNSYVFVVCISQSQDFRLCVSRGVKSSHGYRGPYGTRGLYSQYKNTFPNRYVLGISPSPSQAIMALCIERVKIWAWGPYGYRGPYGPGGLCLRYKNTFPNSYVFGTCISSTQAIMVQCIERVKNIGHGDYMAIVAHMVPIKLIS